MGYQPELHQVLPAPNFLPGLGLKEQMRRDHITDELQKEWSVDLEATLSNLKGEDLSGNQLPEDDPNAVIHHRWKWEVENPDDYLPEYLEVRCPHCGSPEVEDEHGNVFPTDVEDRLSTYDRDGNPRPGVVVERHLIDGDVAIFNRQPSLHRMSMLVHEIRVMEGKTFRFNLADCTPYNADFDGDEMNLHVIQSEEARAEARILMRVQEHIISPRYGGSVIGGIHDHITGAYLLTHGEAFLPRQAALDVLSSIGWDGNLPEPVERNGQVGYFGNEIFSLLVRGGFELNFKNRAGEPVSVTAGDVSGAIDKRGIGAEDGRLLDAVVQTHGTDTGAEFINKMTKMTIAICTAMGFTTGIDDEDLPPEAKDEIDRINRAASEKVDEELASFGKDGRKYEARPGRTPLETLEENILTILDEGKAETGNVAKSLLGENNSAVLMATSGARGSMDNLAMMAGSIGQPKVRGKRLERG